MRAIDATVRKNDGLLGVRSFHFFQVYLSHCQGFSGGSAAKESAWHAGDSDSIPVEKIPWRREWLPTLVFLPEEFHGQRSLASCSPCRVGHDWVTTTNHPYKEPACPPQGLSKQGTHFMLFSKITSNDKIFDKNLTRTQKSKLEKVQIILCSPYPV